MPHVDLKIKLFTARSISEEFSSGDTGRLRDEEYGSKAECSSSHSRGESSHKSDSVKDSKKEKEKEERDEGNFLINNKYSKR